jgi:hypothetical protein
MNPAVRGIGWKGNEKRFINHLFSEAKSCVWLRRSPPQGAQAQGTGKKARHCPGPESCMLNATTPKENNMTSNNTAACLRYSEIPYFIASRNRPMLNCASNSFGGFGSIVFAGSDSATFDQSALRAT